MSDCRKTAPQVQTHSTCSTTYRRCFRQASSLRCVADYLPAVGVYAALRCAARITMVAVSRSRCVTASQPVCRQVFLRVMNNERFTFLFRTSAWYFVPTFLCTPPVYSLIRCDVPLYSSFVEGLLSGVTLQERVGPVFRLTCVVCFWVRSNIPAFQHSLADISRWGWGMWALELVAVSAALTSIGESIPFCAATSRASSVS